MSLKTVIETTDGLDEALIPFYAEKDGKFYLNISDVDSHPDVMNLKVAYERSKEDIKTLKTERDQLKAKADGLPADFDPEKWAKLKDGKPDEAALVSLRQELEGKITELEGQLTASKEAARKNAIDRDLTDALTEAGVTTPSFAKAARTMLSANVKIGDDGKPIVETDMGPMALGEHVKRWAAGEGKDFVTPAKGGGGKGGDGGGGSKKFSEMSPAEKTALYRSDPQEYQRAKEAA